MTAANFCRAMAVLSAIGFALGVWRFVVNFAEGHYGWAVAMAGCAVLDAVWFAYFRKEARK